MNILDILITANSNLLRSKLRTLLTILAIFVGAFTLTLTIGIGSGTRGYLDDQISTLAIKDSFIVTKKSDAATTNPISDVEKYDPEESREFNFPMINNNDLETIKKINGINKVYPIYEIETEYISYNSGEKYKTQLNSFVEEVRPALIAGTLPKAEDNNAIILNNKFYKPFGFEKPEDAVGKKVNLVFKNDKNEVLEKELVISGVMVPTIVGEGRSWISQGLTEEIFKFQNKDTLNTSNNYLGALAVTNANLTELEIKDLKDKFNKEGLDAQTFEDQVGVVKSVINAIQAGLMAFGAISLLAATFGIVNTLLMGVYERTKEIGLNKALGMKKRGIFAVFALEAISIGFWGALLGILAGIAVGLPLNNVASKNFLKGFEGFNLFEFPLLPMLFILLLIMTIAFVAGALPSIKASRLNPIDALRHE